MVMSFLQGNTYLKPIQVTDESGKVVKADKVVKGEFTIGDIYKYYGEDGDVQWSVQDNAFIVPLTEEDTFSLKPDTTSEVQVRLLLDDGSVSGSLIEKHYVYKTKSTTRLTESGAGERTGEILQIRLLKELGTSGGTGGTTDYNYLDNKPSINGVTLIGNKTTEDLGIVSEETDPTVPQYVKDITEQDIQSWDNKAEKSEIPDVSEFVTNTVNNLVNYYTKSETDSKLSAVPKFNVEPVDELPTENISSTTVYLLKVGTESPAMYEEYIHVNGAWELLGAAKIDLTEYVKFTDYASFQKGGVVRIGSYGISNFHDGIIGITEPNENEIKNKTSYRAITVKTLDKAVKIGLTTNSEILTDEEKAQAQSWLGIDTLVGDINTALESILGV
jgi:hypothetical protein